MTFQPQPAPAVAYPEGAPGIRMSVEAVAKMMRDGRLDPQLRGWAIDTLTAAGLDGRNNPSTAAQAQALLSAFQKQTVYTPDAAGAEWIQAGHVTLCLRDRCIRGGDCDDLTSALGGAMLSVGLPAYAVKVSYGEGHQQHILVGLVDESGKYLYADPSTNRPIQKMVPQAVEEIWVDPLDQVGSLGTAGAEMVTLGKPMPAKRELYFKGGHWFEFRYGQWWLYAGGKWLPGPVDYQAKGLPGLGRPKKVNGRYWVSNGEVDIELTGLGDVFGQIFGSHSIQELIDLHAALTYQVGQITSAYNCGQAQWQASNPANYQAWTTSYNAALAAWNTEAAKAQTVITAGQNGVAAMGSATGPISLPGNDLDYVLDTNADGEDEFEVLATAFQPFEDLDRQLRSSNSGFPPSCFPDYKATPQPAPDPAQQLYQSSLDPAWHAITKAADKVGEGVKAATPYLAVAAVALGAYAVWRITEALPRRRRA